MNRSGVRALLAPESIAIVGASPDSWYASRLVDNLLSYDYPGTVYYVNPGRDEIDGKLCYDSINDVPEVVDLVVVSIPRDYVVETVRDSAERGIPAALVISAGFAEADETGDRLQSELEGVVEEFGIALCGPNTIGFANMHDEIVVTATCSRKPKPGSIGLVSQSGALAFSTFFDRAADEDLHFAYIVATGNEIGLSFSDYIEFMAHDPRVDVICVYLEGVTDPKRFMAAAADAVCAGTPVMAVKIGRSVDAEQASISHTGSITGNDDIWNAALRQSGIERVEDIPDLLHRASVHAKYEPPKSNRLCVLSTSGGLASLLADLAADRGLDLPPLSPSIERALLDRDDLLTFGSMPNPADIRGYGADILPEIADLVFADPQFDAYLIAIALPAVGERAEPLRKSLLEVASMAEKPVVVCWTGRKRPDAPTDEPLAFEAVRRELPLYYDPAKAVDAIASLVRFGGVRNTVAPIPKREVGIETTDLSLPSDSVLEWRESVDVLGAADISTVQSTVAADSDEAISAARSIGYPIAMKVDSDAIPHRSDIAAVEVGIEDDEDVVWAYDRITTAASEEVGRSITDVIVQPAVSGVEVLIGISSDELFGPVITLSSGGEFVELTREGIVIVPPVSQETVRSIIADSPLDPVLAGFRGRESVDREALIDLIVRIGDLAIADDRIEELDLNPVIVTQEGAEIVDILVKTAP